MTQQSAFEYLSHGQIPFFRLPVAPVAAGVPPGTGAVILGVGRFPHRVPLIRWIGFACTPRLRAVSTAGLAPRLYPRGHISLLFLCRALRRDLAQFALG